MKKNETEESYKLTVKGLVFSVLRDHEQTSQVIDAMELYMRRFYSKDGTPGIVLNPDRNCLEFVTLQRD